MTAAMSSSLKCWPVACQSASSLRVGIRLYPSKDVIPTECISESETSHFAHAYGRTVEAHHRSHLRGVKTVEIEQFDKQLFIWTKGIDCGLKAPIKLRLKRQ